MAQNYSKTVMRHVSMLLRQCSHCGSVTTNSNVYEKSKTVLSNAIHFHKTCSQAVLNKGFPAFRQHILKTRPQIGFQISRSQTHLVGLQPKPRINHPVCAFHSSPRRNIHPVLLMLIKPVAKFSAALTGRSVRKWFRGLGPEERAKFWSAVKRRWYISAGVPVVVTGSAVGYYYTHIEQTPITGRRRFIAFTHDQIHEIALAETKSLRESYGDRLFPESAPETHRVLHVMNRLLKANPEMNSNLPFDNWEIYVIDDPLINACVLPNGCVFVFKGMLDMATTQDELAIVLGHEVSHAVLSHGVEELSLATFVDFFVIMCMAAIWTILPTDGLALVTQWFHNKVIKLLTHMPHSRLVEKEADKVGLMFAAKACFDIRAGSVLWNKMALNETLEARAKQTEKLPEWMSTHPDSYKRAEHLDFLLPQAEELRSSMKCPRLPKEDPRQLIAAVSEAVNNQLTAQKAGLNLAQVSKAK